MAQKMRDFALEVHFSKWEFAARYNLTASDAQSMALAELLEMAEPEARQAFETLHLGYTETYGAPALRQAIATTYDHRSAEDILCLAGAGEGIYIAMQVLLEPDDHVIVITPNYQSAETVPLSLCEVSGVALDSHPDWSLDIDRIRQALRPNTKLISVNFPNNPTGMIPPQETLDELVACCRQHGIWLFSDEVYRGLEIDRARRVTQVADLYERGISLNVMSKAYGLPGLRIGWMACQDREFLTRCERYKHFLSICNSAPSEVLAGIALEAREHILQRNRDLVRRNRAVVHQFFSDFPHLFEWNEPQGGCVGFVRYQGSDGVEEMTRRLVEEVGVLLLPSSIYRSEVGSVPPDYFRIGLGRSFVPEAVDVMRSWIVANG